MNKTYQLPVALFIKPDITVPMCVTGWRTTVVIKCDNANAGVIFSFGLDIIVS